MDKITDGLKHDGGKLRLSLVPGEAIEAIGAVMTHGAEKYSPNSWRQVDPERYRDALMRHVCKWLKDPHGKDEDSGMPHLWHIITNAAFLCELDKPTEAGTLDGAEKYGKDSYKGVDPERYRDALMRHVCKWLKDPHGIDEDSGMPHLWHIITNAAFLCELDKPTEAGTLDSAVQDMCTAFKNFSKCIKEK